MLAGCLGCQGDADQEGPPCEERDKATCDGACVQLKGSWLDADGTLHHDEFVACTQGDVCHDGSNCGVECTGAITCAADESGTVYWFRGGGGCVPSGWVSSDTSSFPAELVPKCDEINCAIIPQACDDADAGPPCDPDEVEGYYCCDFDVVSEPECVDGTWRCASGSLTNDDPCEKLGPDLDGGL